MTTAFIIAAVIASLIAVTGMLLLFCRLRKVPRVGSDTPLSSPRISIVIPARNEEENLGVLLPSILQQSLAPLEVIVIDDHSDDQTAGIAESFGCRVIRSKDLPDGWYGKPWACQQGAEAAKGETLFFLDADVQLEPSALARLAACSEDTPGSVLSICPWHRTEKPYEQFSVFFNLLMVGGIGAFTFMGDRAKGIGLFGQTLWISKKHYHEIGGHESVKKTVLENLHLAGDLERMGVERLCFIGKDCISMRMFPGGFGELASSWAKGFSSGASLTSTLAITLSALWLTGLMALAIVVFLLPLAGPEARPWVIGCHLLIAAGLLVIFRKVGQFSLANALFFPFSLFFYQGLFAYSLIRKRQGGHTQWKGRDVV